MTSIRAFIPALLLLFGSVFGQQVKWGPFNEQKGDYSLFSVQALGGGDACILKRSQRSFLGVAPKAEDWLIQNLEGNLALSTAKNLYPFNAEVQIDIEFAIASKGRLFVFGSYNDKKSSKKTLFCREWLAKSGQFTGSSTKVIETKYSKFYNPLDFALNVSNDHSKFLVYALDQNENQEPVSYRFVVLDEALNLEWSGTHVLPTIERDFSVGGIGVTDQGMVYVLGEHHIDRKQNRFNYQITIHEKGKEVREHEFESGDQQLEGLSFDFSTPGFIRGFAFYAESGSKELGGAATLELETNSMTMKPLAYRPLKGKIAGLGENLPFHTLSATDYVQMADGGAVIVAQYDWDAAASNSGFSHIWDAIAIRLSAKGEVVWAARIPKHQKFGGSGLEHAEIVAFSKGQDVYLLYNDDVANISLPLDAPSQKCVFNVSNIGLISAKIDETGQVTRSVLVGPKDVKGIAVTSGINRIGNDQYLLRSKDLGKGDIFGVLSF